MAISVLTDYRYLLEQGRYKVEYLDERFLFWYRRCKTVIDNLKLSGAARIDTDRLSLMVLSYFADIVRLKDFHPNIQKTRRVIIYAYSFYWFLRCSPIQLTNPMPKNRETGISRSGFLNEMTVASVWISEFVCPLHLDKKRVERYLQELIYYFRYRNYNAQSLEAALTALVLGSGGDPFYDGGEDEPAGKKPE